MLKRLVMIAGLVGQLHGADAAVLAEGRRLVAELTLVEAADVRLFQAAGVDRAATLLAAVMGRGQEADATVEDWTAMHRAVAGLVELYTWKGELFRASVFAYAQSTQYRNFERDYAAALRAAEQALDLQRRSGMLETIDIAWSAVAENQISLGQWEGAAASLREARLAAKDPFANRTARVWRDLVRVELSRGKKREAEAELAGFLDKARLGPAYFQGQAQLAQAEMRMEAGEFGGALEAMRAARGAMKGDASFDYEVVNLLMTCVLESMHSLAYAEALALARRIDAEFKGLPFAVAAFAEIAMRTRRRLAGDIDGVLREDTERLERGRREGNVYLQIEALRSLATTYRSFHSVGLEVTALEAAVELERGLLPAGGVPVNRVAAREWARGLIQLGEAYVAAGQVGKAGRVLTEAIRSMDAQTAAGIRQNLAPVRARAVLARARLAELDDDADTAREILEGALKGGGAFDRSDVLLQLARLERGEQAGKAVRYYEEAIGLLHAGRQTAWEVTARLEVARVLTGMGELDRARAQVAAATAGAEAAKMAGAQWRARFVAGLIAEKAGDAGAAVAAFEDAMRGLEAFRSGLQSTEQRQALGDGETVTELYQRMVGALTRLGRTEEAWRTVERGKARAFAEGLQGRRFQEIVPAGARPELAKLEQEMLRLRVQLAPENEALLRGAGREPAALRAELERVQARFALAREQAGLAESRGSRAVTLAPPALRAVQGRLGAGVALVEYSLLGDGVTAFVVTRDTMVQVDWKTNGKALRSAVLRLRGLLADGNSGEQLGPVLEQVSGVWKPVAAKLPAGVTRLVIVPAGYLHYLPFQVLPGEDGRALVDRYAISYLPSASTLLLLGEGKKGKRDLFLGALGNVKVDGWAPLPGTLRETEGIAKLYPGAARAVEAGLTHDRAARALRENGHVHFATHGVLDEHSPLFSALLVSPSEGRPARLSMYELMELPVRAETVVLSACETGLGKMLGGDEVAGLTRTLLAAGARTVVSSLWKVSDEATALLMDGFYRRLRGGDTAAKAMRGAALDVRKQYPHPFYWAPFLVTGAI